MKCLIIKLNLRGLIYLDQVMYVGAVNTPLEYKPQVSLIFINFYFVQFSNIVVEN